MRCKHLVLRNGYWTGKRCSKTATFMVALDGEEVGQAMCTQHKNEETKRRLNNKHASITATPLPKEK